MNNLRVILGVAFCIGLGSGVYFFTEHHLKKRAPTPKQRPLAVNVTTLQSCDLADRIELVGSLEPLRQVTIRTTTSGYITKLPFDVGDRLEDQPQPPIVVELEDAQNRAMLKGAEAALKVAQAQLEAKSAQKQLAEDLYRRQQTLARSRAISQQEVEQAKSQVAVAKAEAELEQARVEQAQSESQRSRIALEEMRIRTPHQGFVAERFVDVGDLANPNDPLLRIVDISKVRTIVQVVEKDYEKVQVGQTVAIQVDAFPQRSFEGEVIRKAPVLDPETRTGAAQIEIDNPLYDLKPGMHARVSIVAQRRDDARALPIASVVRQLEQSIVYVVSGEPARASPRKVQTGIVDGPLVEILSGIGPGERVVTLGSHIVEDGQFVTPLSDPSLREDLLADQIQGGGDAVGGG